jgi:hypothetical protein
MLKGSTLSRSFENPNVIRKGLNLEQANSFARILVPNLVFALSEFLALGDCYWRTGCLEHSDSGLQLEA